VGIELLIQFTKSHAVTVLPTANQMNWSQMELSWFGTLELTYRTPESTCPITRLTKTCAQFVIKTDRWL
jgi:hypothetical protein